MRATGFTHVSVHAYDLDESVRFYEELFGMEEIPSPHFPFPVRWLRIGDLQLHLFRSEDSAPQTHHFGLNVDDFEALYLKVKELGVREASGYYANVYELPDGAAQMYVRDPAGNLVEIDYPDVASLDRSIVGDVQKLDVPQTGEAANAKLYLSRPHERQG